MKKTRSPDLISKETQKLQMKLTGMTVGGVGTSVEIGGWWEASGSELGLPRARNI